MALDDRYTNKFAPLDSMAIYHKPGHHLLYTPMTGEIKCPRLYLCLAHSILSPPMLMQHMHQPITKWYDPLHIITWPYWFIDLDLTCSSLLRWSISAKSCSSFIVTHGPSLRSLWLALYSCNRSIKPSLVLTFYTLVTWLHVMSHMPWVPSSHIHLWTNFLCILISNTY